MFQTLWDTMYMWAATACSYVIFVCFHLICSYFYTFWFVLIFIQYISESSCIIKYISKISKFKLINFTFKSLYFKMIFYIIYNESFIMIVFFIGYKCGSNEIFQHTKKKLLWNKKKISKIGHTFKTSGRIFNIQYSTKIVIQCSSGAYPIQAPNINF